MLKSTASIAFSCVEVVDEEDNERRAEQGDLGPVKALGGDQGERDQEDRDGDRHHRPPVAGAANRTSGGRWSTRGKPFQGRQRVRRPGFPALRDRFLEKPDASDSPVTIATRNRARLAPRWRRSSLRRPSERPPKSVCSSRLTRRLWPRPGQHRVNTTSGNSRESAPRGVMRNRGFAGITAITRECRKTPEQNHNPRVGGSSPSSGIRQTRYWSGFPSVSAGCEIGTRLGGTGIGPLVWAHGLPLMRVRKRLVWVSPGNERGDAAETRPDPSDRRVAIGLDSGSSSGPGAGRPSFAAGGSGQS